MLSMKNNEEQALQVLKVLQKNSFEAYFAGGCIRDKLLKKIPTDFDIATSAKPNEIKKIFDKTLDIGKKFGTIVVNDFNTSVEVTTFRTDENYADGRHPSSINFSNSKEDAARRDFTINGLFYNPIKDEIIDSVGGKKDLNKKIIRAIGDPYKRFNEDYLRMLRAVRFQHTLGFSIEPNTEDAIKKNAKNITKISIERIENEFTRILTESQKPGDALESLRELGLLQYIFPKIEKLIGVNQPPNYHPEGDVYTHVKLMLNLSTSSEILPSFSRKELCYAILFHDISKPETFIIENDNGKERIRFLGHEVLGADVTDKLLKKFNISNKLRNRVVHVIRNHMKPFQAMDMKVSTLRRLMSEPTFDLLLELHRLDGLGSRGLLESFTFLKKKKEEYTTTELLPTPWITGNDLKLLGFKDGQKLGHTLEKIYDLQLEEKFHSKEELTSWVKNEFK